VVTFPSKVDLVALQDAAYLLLEQSFAEYDCSESEQLTLASTKLHNMLRSPRFSQQAGNSALFEERIDHSFRFEC
jgi:hypothetical protein